MADDPRRFDDLVRTVAQLRAQLDTLQNTLLNRMATHTHAGGGTGGTSGVSSVTAGDSTITIGGTSSAPTVAVNAIPESKVTNLTTDLAGKAATVHTHAAGDVTSGTFGIGLLPTGTSSSTVALGNHTHTDLTDLHAGTSATVSTSESTTSTTYADLATVGPTCSITLAAPRRVLVFVKGRLLQATTTQGVLMSWAASGATTLAVSDANAVIQNGSGNYEAYTAIGYLDCNAGTTTFTAKYRVIGGQGTYQDRVIAVVPT